MLFIAALLIVVLLLIFFVKSKVEDIEDVPVTDVPADVIDVAVEDITMVVAEDVTEAGIEDVTEVSEEELETLYQVLSPLLSPPRSSRRSSKAEAKGRKPRSKTLKTKTYTSYPSTVIIEEETEAELLARKFDEQLYGRRAAKARANYWDLKPVGRRPRDNKEKGDFRVDRRLKVSRQKAVVESRTA